MVLADVEAKKTETPDHQWPLDGHAINHLPPRLEHTADFGEGLQLRFGLEMLQNADEQDGIEVIIRIRHLKDVARLQMHRHAASAERDLDGFCIGREIESVNLLVHIARVHKRQSLAEADL